jgi:cytoskeletal protein CcmA (bactofilin family)
LFKKDNLETPLDKINTVIGKDTSFNGTLTGKGLIRIDGEAEGSIANKGDLIIGESGRVKVDLKARNVTIAGYYEGALEAEGRLELKKTATAIGTFKTNGLLVEEGAVISGSLEMKVKDEAAPSESKKSWESKPSE